MPATRVMTRERQELHRIVSHQHTQYMLAQICGGQEWSSTTSALGGDYHAGVLEENYCDTAQWTQDYAAACIDIALEGLNEDRSDRNIASFHLHVVRPLIRELAMQCFVQHWPSRKNCVGFTCRSTDSTTGIQDWAEELIFGGCISLEGDGLRLDRANRAPFTVKPTGFDASEGHVFDMLPFEPEIDKRRRYVLNDFPDIMQYMEDMPQVS